MEILFENRYERTPQVSKEIYRALCFKRPVHIVLYVIMGIVSILNIVAGIFCWEFSCIYLVYFALILLMQAAIYTKAVNTAIKRDQEQLGSASVKVCVEVTEQGIRCVYAETASKPVALSNIRKVFTTKNFIVLYTKANMIYMFQKEKFTIGTLDDFLAYLRSKGLKI